MQSGVGGGVAVARESEVATAGLGSGGRVTKFASHGTIAKRQPGKGVGRKTSLLNLVEVHFCQLNEELPQLLKSKIPHLFTLLPQRLAYQVCRNRSQGKASHIKCGTGRERVRCKI